MLKLVPDITHIKFLNARVFGMVISMILLGFTAFTLSTQGLNFGIDFKGGILMEVKTPGPADLSDLRAKVEDQNLGDFSLQTFGNPDEVLINIQNQDSSEANQAAIEAIRSVMPNGTEYRRTEVVGPKVGGELVEAGAKAVIYALLGILIYIWFRFEWQYGVGAVIALAHDVILTLGFFSFLQLDFNLSTVAAILTIAGYSINDTVIIYDRIREELRKYKTKPVPEVINLALNKTLSRTVLTSFTTLLALFSLYFLGGEVIAGFALAMIWGIGIGTYSSLFIAAPILSFFDLRKAALKRENEGDSAERFKQQP